MINLENTIEKIFATRRITRDDQQRLMHWFSKENLSVEDKHLINRVHEALIQGRLRVVD